MISVIVCTYNRVKFIEDCLDHLYKQTLSKNLFEVIVINNNSTDTTEEVVATFKKTHKDFILKNILTTILKL